MHVISRKKLREFWEKHSDAEVSLINWFKLASHAEWWKFSDLKAVCATADVVGNVVVINIGGNKYRLIIRVYYEDQVVLVRHVLTHLEYDKGGWRE
jgi:mRNA interferase HigB